MRLQHMWRATGKARCRLRCEALSLAEKMAAHIRNHFEVWTEQDVPPAHPCTSRFSESIAFKESSKPMDKMLRSQPPGHTGVPEDLKRLWQCLGS